MNRYGYLILGIIGGIALGFIFGRAYGIHTGMQIAEANRRASMGPKVEVIAAAQDIPAGTTLEPRLLGKMTVFSSTVRDQINPEDADHIFGKKIIFKLKKREPMTWQDIEGGDIRTNQQPARAVTQESAQSAVP
jgi:hypothetical protein